MAWTTEQIQNMIAHLIKENLSLKARLIVLQKVLLVSQAEGNPQQLQHLEGIFQKEVEATLEHMIAHHPMLDQAWKKLFLNELGDIEGLSR